MTKTQRSSSRLLENALAWLSTRSGEGEPAWLLQRRNLAADRFREAGLPHAKHEAWRFAPLGNVTRIGFKRPIRGSGADEEEEGLAWFEAALPRWNGEVRIVLVNGRLHSRHANVLPAGIEVQPLHDALQSSPQLLERHLGETANTTPALGPQAFADLNTALFDGGVVLHVREGARLETPVHLVHVTSGLGGPLLTLPRTLVVVAPQSQATLVETYIGPEGGTYLTNAVTEVSLADGAILEHVRVQREGTGGDHIATLAVRQHRNANYRSRVVAIGARFARLELHVGLVGEGAECTLDGLYVGDDSQHLDHHTLVDHRVPHGTSRQRYKGILSGSARSVFDGRVRIFPDAQKTNVTQENRNLLLSEGALAHAKPSLEIEADDVKASHGTTVGQLDADAIFYLRARGLDLIAARALLTYGFALEILNDIPVRPLAERLAREALGVPPKSNGDPGEEPS